MNIKTFAEKKRLAIGLFFVLGFGGAIFVPYALPVAEPARILVLGAALIGLAIWARRYLQRHKIG
jgi:hypothetical protein